MTTYPNVKLNLGLNVLRKRADGFHDIETLFIPYYGVSDILDIDILPAGEKVTIGITGPKVDWDPAKDLTVKAYEILDADYDLPPVSIRLVKRSPVGAGLGGGSADAAFALKMLNGMFSLGLTDAMLAEYAARLGSDCAFFIYNRPMLGTGRGEILAPYDVDLSAYDIRVEIPEGVAVSTREAYGGIIPRENRKLTDVLSLPVKEWKGSLVNDFEETVFRLHPEIAALKDRFYAEGAVYASMSGSGSSVFGLFEK